MSNGKTVSLTKKHQDMAHFIALGESKTKARILAGHRDYALGLEGDAASKGKELNAQYAWRMVDNNPDILVLADHLRTVKRKELSLTVDDLLRTSAAILSFDPGCLFTDDGEMITNIKELDPASRAAIKEFRIKEHPDGSKTLEVKFYCKIQAIGMLSKLNELSGDKVRSKVTDKKIQLKTF